MGKERIKNTNWKSRRTCNNHCRRLEKVEPQAGTVKAEEENQFAVLKKGSGVDGFRHLWEK